MRNQGNVSENTPTLHGAEVCGQMGGGGPGLGRVGNGKPRPGLGRGWGQPGKQAPWGGKVPVPPPEVKDYAVISF